MIEFAKITGEMEGTNLQVRMRTGECLFAPMVVLGVGATLPTQEWIDQYKDEFLAMVSYEGETFYDPMVIGFFPVKGADSPRHNTTYRTFRMLVKLVEQLLKAKVNTQLGPQPFMPDTIKVLDEVKKELEDIEKLMLNIKKE